MWIWKPKKKRDSRLVERDRLEMMRMQLQPGTEAYDHINQEIKELQAQITTDKLNRRRMTPEGRKTLGTVLGGIILLGANTWVASKGPMLTGQDAKNREGIMGSVIRGLFDGLKHVGK